MFSQTTNTNVFTPQSEVSALSVGCQSSKFCDWSNVQELCANMKENIQTASAPDTAITYQYKTNTGALITRVLIY